MIIRKNHITPSGVLKQKRVKLISGFLNGKEPEFIYKHSRLIDDYFRTSFKTNHVGPETNCSIIALGGYGREEQCICSDVDLLILFDKQVPEETEDLVRKLIYPMWDLGLDVGHATRSLNECLDLAAENFEVLTSLLDARFICGLPHLYTNLIETLREKVINRLSKKIISWIVERNESRHQHFGDSTYLLEPNLKEGRGGLRDYHAMLWIARIKSNLTHPQDLKKYGYLLSGEFKSFTNALYFIWNIRSRLHHMASRKCDQLFLEHQIKMAESMKFKKKEGRLPVERFLGELHGQMEFVKQQNLMFLAELGYIKLISKKQINRKPIGVIGLKVDRNMLNFTSAKAVLRSPDLLIKIFEESARLKIPLSANAKRVMLVLSNLVDDEFRKSASVIRAFENILKMPSPMFNPLNEMLNTGLLVGLIPEFKKIVNRIQFDEYHLYPVDRHSLRTVQTIKKFGTTEDPAGNALCGNLYKASKRKKLLLWAALLHDIGKGEHTSGHAKRGAEIAKTILKRINYKDKQIKTVYFLIAEHLFLIKIATRRDINDEETAIFCARRIKDIGHLKMLYLLTVADCLSTGTIAWSDWTAALLRNLFLNVMSILEKGELATSETVKIVGNKKMEVIQTASTEQERKELEDCFNVMSPRYLLYTPANRIIEHIRLYNMLESREFVWEVDKNSGTHSRTITICAKDQPGLFSKIAGVFTLNNLNILSAQVYTWRNNIALDIFKVTPPPDLIFEDEKWVLVKNHMKSVLAENIDLTTKIRKKISEKRPIKRHTRKRPHRVEMDNTSSSFFTIIEVFTYDFPGLLFSITNALFKCRLDVWVARIATKVDQVVDVFYVRNFDGQKIDAPDEVLEIKTAIEKVLLVIDN